ESLIRGRETAFENDARLFQTEPGGVRAAPDGDEYDIGLDRCARAIALDGDRDRLRGLGNSGDPRTQLEGDAPALVCLLECRTRRRILVHNEVIERLDDRHLGAERTPRARKLDPDNAAAENGDASGNARESERGLGI